MNNESILGSSGWTGGAEYHGEYADRIDQFVKAVDDNALKKYASGLRENRPCVLSREFSVGNDNLVRKIEFDDGIKWVARLRMPRILHDTDGAASSHHNYENEKNDRSKSVLVAMRSELATMEFVQ